MTELNTFEQPPRGTSCLEVPPSSYAGPELSQPFRLDANGATPANVAAAIFYRAATLAPLVVARSEDRGLEASHSDLLFEGGNGIQDIPIAERCKDLYQGRGLGVDIFRPQDDVNSDYWHDITGAEAAIAVDRVGDFEISYARINTRTLLVVERSVGKDALSRLSDWKLVDKVTVLTEASHADGTTATKEVNFYPEGEEHQVVVLRSNGRSVDEIPVIEQPDLLAVGRFGSSVIGSLEAPLLDAHSKAEGRLSRKVFRAKKLEQGL